MKKNLSTYKRAWTLCENFLIEGEHCFIKYTFIDKVWEKFLNWLLELLQAKSELSHYLIIDTAKLDNEDFDKSLDLFEKSL